MKVRNLVAMLSKSQAILDCEVDVESVTFEGTKVTLCSAKETEKFFEDSKETARSLKRKKRKRKSLKRRKKVLNKDIVFVFLARGVVTPGFFVIFALWQKRERH